MEKGWKMKIIKKKKERKKEMDILIPQYTPTKKQQFQDMTEQKTDGKQIAMEPPHSTHL